MLIIASKAIKQKESITLMKQIKKKFLLVAAAVLAVAGLFPALSNIASAAQIVDRSVTIGSSAASAVTTYTFNFDAGATTLQSVAFQACTTASGTCTTPAGFSVTGSTLASQPTGLGAASGWTVNTATAGSLRLSNSSNVTAPGATQSVSFGNVTNPSATNSTFFFRITTHSNATWSAAVDTGTVATSTAGLVTVTASVDETLTFTLATTSVPLGTLSTSSTASGTSTMSASTNATTGYTVTVNGTTLTSGSNTITALASPTAAATNTKQFGINLMANTAPTVGTAVSGTGTGAPATGYNTANSFKFVSTDVVASASVPTNTNNYTVSYIANIDGVTAPGSYQTILNYVATANY